MSIENVFWFMSTSVVIRKAFFSRNFLYSFLISNNSVTDLRFILSLTFRTFTIKVPHPTNDLYKPISKRMGGGLRFCGYDHFFPGRILFSIIFSIALMNASANAIISSQFSFVAMKNTLYSSSCLISRNLSKSSTHFLSRWPILT